MKRTALYLSIYTAMLLIGGVIGYVKAGSAISLITSTLSASLLLIGIYVLAKETFWGYPFSIVVVAFLDVVFFFRFLKTMALFPSGALFITSSFFLTTTVLQMISALRQRREQSF